MKHYLGMLAMAGLLMSCNPTPTQQADYGVIPLPQSVAIVEAKPFVLKSGVKIGYPEGDEQMHRNAAFLAEYLKTATGKNFGIVAGATGENVISLTLGLENENPEAYQLTVSDKGVQISAPSAAGVFYGIQTLRKSLPVAPGEVVALPAVTIADSPRFAYRGAHFDVSRHCFT